MVGFCKARHGAPEATAEAAVHLSHAELVERQEHVAEKRIAGDISRRKGEVVGVSSVRLGRRGWDVAVRIGVGGDIMFIVGHVDWRKGIEEGLDDPFVHPIVFAIVVVVVVAVAVAGAVAVTVGSITMPVGLLCIPILVSIVCVGGKYSGTR